LDRSGDSIRQNRKQTGSEPKPEKKEKRLPASERLREYLVGLEKKLETVENWKINSNSPRINNSNNINNGLL